MQTTGKLSELPLSGILEAVQKERATGTLHLASDDSEAIFYFLFGHLFHAANGGLEGEAVVYDALNWESGEFTFDAKAKLPAEETIKASTAELLANRPQPGSKPKASKSRATVEVVPDPVPDRELEAEEPAPVHPRRRATDVRPDTRPPETMVLYPVPRGNLIYESLTASFVDFPKVLRKLGSDRHTGYVRLTGDEYSGVLIFDAGSVVEAIYDASGAVTTGSTAFNRIAAHIDKGDGVLDVIELSHEMVGALYQLLTAPSLYEKLLGRFIKADALVDYLHDEHYSGAIIVRADPESGIVLLKDGEVLGAYTSQARDVAVKADQVLALCDVAGATVEVRGGPVPETLPVLVAVDTPAPATPVLVEDEAASEEADEEPDETEAVVAAEPVINGTPPAEVNWAAVIGRLAERADEVLGGRSKKVKELLLSTAPTQHEVEATVDRISELSIMFVDPSKLTALADDMRAIAAGTA